MATPKINALILQGRAGLKRIKDLMPLGQRRRGFRWLLWIACLPSGSVPLQVWLRKPATRLAIAKSAGLKAHSDLD